MTPPFPPPRHKLVGHLFCGRGGAGADGGSDGGTIIADELKRRRWKEAELRTRASGDAEKLAFAARLRAGTTMTVGWIAKRLGTGRRGYLNHLLYRQRKSGRK